MFLVVGSATVDLFVTGLDRMPALAGDEFTVDSLVFCDAPLALSPGGNGCNTAFVLGRLGAPVVLGSAVGRDRLGDLLSGWLAEAGVDARGLVRTAGAATSTTTIVTDRSRNRLSFHHAGATHAYAPADLPEALLGEARVLLVCAYPLLQRWRPDGVREVLARARRGGAITALDIGPAIDPPARLAEIAPLLPLVDYLLCNAHELAVCVGGDDPDAGARRLREAGAGCVVLKQGAAGATVYRPGPAGGLHVPGRQVAVRSTVGAGDAFDAGLLWAVHEGWDLADGVRFANAVAAYVVASERGVLDSPTAAEVLGSTSRKGDRGL